ncbi:MAG: alpha-amylase family glycosyl hydrolase [Acidobacteriota bacterium]|nr:alpha-amylase family glycosyl hydrolase [Acidobacteriota bacterium]
MVRALRPLVATIIAALAIITSQCTAQTLSMTKADPPNWWANMPKPMLLIRGEGLTGATFTLSDKTLHIERTTVSSNGHWAFLWLAASPAKPETIQLRAAAHGETAALPYTFAARRAQTDGFAGFSSRDVMYLIMTDRFADGDPTNDGPHATSSATSADAAAERAKPRGWHGGDLRGIAQHLDYLQQLGITTIWMTPVVENHRFDSYHGYGATDMYRVDEHFGSLAGLKALSAALHDRHMKLVLDEVPNHVGPDHPWVADEPMPDWFHGTAANHRPGASNFTALLDPHAPERDRIDTTEGWFAGLLPDMNTENPAVALYLRQNVIWWVEQSGADGIRIDTFPYIDRAFWKDYLGVLHHLYPRLTEVGEAKSTDPVFTSSYAGGVTRAGADTTLWTPFDFPLEGALHRAFAEGGPLSGIANVLALDALYPHPERLVTLLDNHDEPRFRSEAKSSVAMKLALGVLLTTRGLPQIYSGDELALPGGGDPDNRRDFPGGFANTPRSAFTDAGRTPEERLMHDWVAQLSTLRQTHPALACGGEQMLNSDDNTLVYVRDAANGCGDLNSKERLLIAVHRGKPAASVNLDFHATWMQGCPNLAPILPADGSGVMIDVDRATMRLPSDSIVILQCP